MNAEQCVILKYGLVHTKCGDIRVGIGQRRPSTIIMWYPKFVLTRDETMGLSTVDGVRANAASWKAPTILPRAIHPKLPPAEQYS